MCTNSYKPKAYFTNKLYLLAYAYIVQVKFLLPFIYQSRLLLLQLVYTNCIFLGYLTPSKLLLTEDSHSR